MNIKQNLLNLFKKKLSAIKLKDNKKGSFVKLYRLYEN